MERLYLLDGFALIFRSYFALLRQPLRNAAGQNMSAVFGFFRTLLALFKQYQPHQFAVILDSPGPTFRHEKFPEYKATRQAAPDELILQIPIINQGLAILGMPMLRADGFEADDIIATLADRCRKSGQPCAIVSADKDLMQLVDDNVHLLRPSKDGGGLDELGPAEVFADKGVRPDQILDYLSLLGDTADNVPGVAGVGDKTATKLLADFGTMDGIYANLESIPQAGLRDKLTAGKDSAYLSRWLVDLRRDVEVPGYESSEAFNCRGINGTALAALLQEYGIRQLAADYQRLFPGDSSVPSAAVAQATIDIASEATPAATAKGPRRYDSATQHYHLIDTVAGLKELCQKLATAEIIAIDTETNGLDAHTAKLCGISLCAEAGTAYYAAFWGPEGEVIPLEAVRADLLAFLQRRGVKFVAQNAKFDWQMLAANGLRPVDPWFDTMIAAWLVNTTRNHYGMDELSLELLNYEPISFDSLFSPETVKAAKKDPTLQHFSRVPLREAATYSAEDTDVTLQLYQALSPKLKALDLEQVFHTVEMPLIPVLADMEWKGMGIDVMELGRYSQELEVRLAALEQEIYGLVGHPFNINSTKQLQDVLFVERKLVPSKKTKTGYSTDVAVLEELALQDPVPRKILQFRTLNKLKSTYVDALPAMVNPKTGRIHTSFVQTGTATGRVASHDPNLQNIPIREEDGRRIRLAFIPAPDRIFVSADYSQIELVIMAHLAKDPGLSLAFAEGIDVHALTASKIFGGEPSAVTSDQRRIAKMINFGVIYGMSPYRLSMELDIPMRDAKTFIDSYFESYPGIKQFIAETVAACERDGGVRTMLGRWRPIPTINSSNKTEKLQSERVAVNTPIQGTAADVVKLAMIALDARLKAEGLQARMILQVHDELILELPEAERETVMRICTEEMTKALTLSVPLKVSVEWGIRWGDMH